MLNSYIIIAATSKIQLKVDESQLFRDFLCLGVFNNHESALNGILETKPQLVLFYFNEKIELSLLSELYQYLDELPYIIAINKDVSNAYSALKLGVSDYLSFPLEIIELRKSFLKFMKNFTKSEDAKLCIKSNGDYHFLPLDDIVYLKADNNTTDFFLQNGKVISGFKTMKFYESQLPFYFFRIHNSYIVNIRFVSRINLGKYDCYLQENDHKLPFSRSYKGNIDTIIRKIG